VAHLEERRLTRLQVIGAVAAGLVLAALPLARFVFVAGHGSAHGEAAAHADHEPRFGGQLGMVGDYHIEVRHDGNQIEAFVSDAQRRPIRPAKAWARFDRGDPFALAIEKDRAVGTGPHEPREVEAIVVLEDGERLSMTFD